MFVGGKKAEPVTCDKCGTWMSSTYPMACNEVQYKCPQCGHSELS